MLIHLWCGLSRASGGRRARVVAAFQEGPPVPSGFATTRQPTTTGIVPRPFESFSKGRLVLWGGGARERRRQGNREAVPLAADGLEGGPDGPPSHLAARHAERPGYLPASAARRIGSLGRGSPSGGSFSRSPGESGGSFSGGS
jgi:hypothetical protein